MIYECFYFWDELDLLDAKLHEGTSVDKFVIVESPTSLTHIPQPLLYQENKQRFKEFEDKIIHIVGDPSTEPPGLVGYGLYIHRYKYLHGALAQCQPNDIIIVDDPDVILKKSTIETLKTLDLNTANACFITDWYFYFMDILCTRLKYSFGWAALYKTLSRGGTYPTFNSSLPSIAVNEAGWHFGKLGGVDKIIQNIHGYPHRECDIPYLTDPVVMQEKIDKGYGWDSVPWGPHYQEVVMKHTPFEASNYPAYIVEHPEIYKQYFKGGM